MFRRFHNARHSCTAEHYRCRQCALAQGILQGAVQIDDLAGGIVGQLEGHLLARLTYGADEHDVVLHHTSAATAFVIHEHTDGVVLGILQSIHNGYHCHIVGIGMGVIGEDLLTLFAAHARIM